LWKSIISPIFSILCLALVLAFLQNSFNFDVSIIDRSEASYYINTPYGISYLHPYNTTNNWKGDISSLKPQMEQDLQLISKTGYKWVVIFALFDSDIAQTLENIEWFSNKTHENGLELIVVCCSNWKYYNTSTPEYQNMIWALGNLSQFEYVKYVSSYCSNYNSTEWWIWYQTLDTTIKEKYIPHVDAPQLEIYKNIYDLGFDSSKYVLLEAYDESSLIKCSYYKKAYVLTGQWRGTATPSDQIKVVERKIAICQRYRQYETIYGVWCFDDTEPDGEHEDYGIYFPYEPYLLIPSHIVEVS